MVQSRYPVQFNVDYPKSLGRLSTLFRLVLAIPMLIIVYLLRYGILFLPTVLMILFRKKYPKWWFDWSLELARFNSRISAYIFLLRDEYPSTDEEQAVHLKIDYPNAKNLNRWLPLVKWLLAIPHYFVLAVLGIASLVSVVIAWFAIIFTGRYPRSLFDFIVGVNRWSNRVVAYSILLTTDKYPPFSLK